MRYSGSQMYVRAQLKPRDRTTHDLAVNAGGVQWYDDELMTAGWRDVALTFDCWLLRHVATSAADADHEMFYNTQHNPYISTETQSCKTKW